MNDKWQFLTEAAINLSIPTTSSIIPIHIKGSKKFLSTAMSFPIFLYLCLKMDGA